MTARDYGFDVKGLEAGRTRVAFRNAGKQPHHVLAFPYNKGATLKQVRTFFLQEGESAGPPPVDFAGATRTTILEGGEEQVAELDLRSGKYALICFISDRAGGPPHAAKGMIAEAVVRSEGPGARSTPAREGSRGRPAGSPPPSSSIKTAR